MFSGRQADSHDRYAGLKELYARSNICIASEADPGQPRQQYARSCILLAVSRLRGRGRLPVCTIEQMILRPGRMGSGTDDLSWDSGKTNSQRLPRCPRALFIPSNKASQRYSWTKYSPC
jgi:hypothetical protein